MGSLRATEGRKSGISETTAIHNAFCAQLWNRNSCHMRLLRDTAEQGCSIYQAEAPGQSEMAQELALCWDGDEGMVPSLSTCDRHRRFRLRTGLAHAAHSAFFKVAHYRITLYRQVYDAITTERRRNTIDTFLAEPTSESRQTRWNTLKRRTKPSDPEIESRSYCAYAQLSPWSLAEVNFPSLRCPPMARGMSSTITPLSVSVNGFSA